MRPRDRLEPVDVAAQTYFSPAFVERAEHFRTGQLWLYGREPGHRDRRCWCTSCGAVPGARWRGARSPNGAMVAAGLSVAVTVATLPVSVIARQRAKDVGLVTQDWVGWAGDVVKGTAIEAVIVAAGRRRARLRHAALRAALVDAGRRRRGRVRRDQHLRRAGDHRPALQPLRPPQGAAARRDPRSRAQGRRQGRRGLRDGRVAAHHRGQRVRDRHRLDQARRHLRHAAQGLPARRGPRRRRPRARPRPPPRRPARAALPADRRPVRHARGRRGWPSAWRRATAARRCRPSRWRSS